MATTNNNKLFLTCSDEVSNVITTASENKPMYYLNDLNFNSLSVKVQKKILNKVLKTQYFENKLKLKDIEKDKDKFNLRLNTVSKDVLFNKTIKNSFDNEWKKKRIFNGFLIDPTGFHPLSATYTVRKLILSDLYIENGKIYEKEAYDLLDLCKTDSNKVFQKRLRTLGKIFKKKNNEIVTTMMRKQLLNKEIVKLPVVLNSVLKNNCKVLPQMGLLDFGSSFEDKLVDVITNYEISDQNISKLQELLEPFYKTALKINDINDSVRSSIPAFKSTVDNTEKITNVVKDELNVLLGTANKVDSTVDKLNIIVDSLKETIDNQIGPEKDLQGVHSIITQLKNNISDTKNNVSYTVKLLYLIISLSIIIYGGPDDWKLRMSIYSGLAVLGAWIFKDELNGAYGIIAQYISKMLSNSNTEVQSQMAFIDGTNVMDFSQLISAVLLAFSSGLGKSLNIPPRLFVDIGNFDKVRNNLNDVLTQVLGIFNKLYNFIAEKFGGKEVKFLEASNNNIRIFDCEYDEIMALEEKNEYWRNPMNMSRLKILISEGTNIIKDSRRNNINFGLITIMQKRVLELEKLLKIFIACNIGTAGVRQEPVGILLRGGPSVGKSIIMQHINNALLSKILSEKEYRDYLLSPESFLWNRQFENTYWDGITPQCKIVMFDDFMQSKDIAGNPDSEAMNIIRAINSFECILHCAEMHLKGNVRLNCEFVVASTNAVVLQPQSIINTEALVRRFPMSYICTPKMIYCTGETVHNDYYNRRFDKNKLDKNIIMDMEDPYNPGVFEITDLNQHTVEFVPCNMDGVPCGDAIDFNEFIDLALFYRTERRRWFLNSQNNFNKTSMEYRGIKNIDRELQMETIQPQGDFDFLDELGPAKIQPSICNYKSIHELIDEGFVFNDSIVAAASYFRLKLNRRFKNEAEIRLHIRNIMHGVYDMYILPEMHTDVLLYSIIADFRRDAAKVVFEDNYNDVNYQYYGPSLKSNVPSMIQSIKDWIKNLNIPGNIRSFLRDFSYIKNIWPVLIFGFGSLFGNFLYRKCFSNETKELVYPTRIIKQDIEEEHFNKKVTSSSIDSHSYNTESQSINFGDKLKNIPKKSHRTRPMKNLKDVKPQMGSCSDPSGQELMESIVRTNMYTMTMKKGDKIKNLGFATFVIDQMCVIPYHFIKQFKFWTDNGTVLRKDVVTFQRANSHSGFSVFVMDILSGAIEGNLCDQDVILVRIKGSPRHRDITSNFIMADRLDLLSHSIKTVLFLPTRNISAIATTARVLDQPVEVCNLTKQVEDYEIAYGFAYGAATRDGDCGALLGMYNAKLPKEKFLGIHVAGVPQHDVGYTGLICYEDLMDDLERCGELISGPVVITDTFEKGEVEAQGGFSYLGHLNKFPYRVKVTTLTKSPLYGKWSQPITGTSQLVPRLVDGILLDPMKIAMSKYCQPPVPFDMKILFKSTTSIKQMIHTNEIRRLTPRVLTIEEALDGLELEVNYGKIPSNTSAGYPMNVSGCRNLKKEYFKGNAAVKALALIDIKKEVFQMLDSMLEGKRVVVLWTDSLKDERREISKILSCSTRMFSGCPFIYQIVFRMYFGMFCLYMNENKIINGFTSGVNPYSGDWDEIARLLRFKNSGRDTLVGAGDYSKFDGSQKPLIHEYTNQIINDWYDDEHTFLRKVIISELTNSFHISDGKVYEWASSLPSGHPGTLLFNGFYNHFAFRYCWELAGLDVKEFNKSVYLIVQGDDNLFSVVPRFREDFNELVLPKLMEVIGLNYTTEIKSNATSKFRLLEEVEFLKRSFKYDNSLGRFVSRLRLNVILEIPYWTRKGSDYDKITITNTEECLKELSAYEKDVFDLWSKKILSAFRNTHLKFENLMFCSYEELREKLYSSELFY
jgi:hypothetical protein